MKKIACFILIICLLFTFTAYAEPLPVISCFDFMPDGQPYHYYTFGDEWWNVDVYDGKDFIHYQSMSKYLPKGIEYDGFVRYTVAMNGNSYYTNQRYKIDEPNFDAYPKEGKKTPLFIKAKNQSGKSVVDDGKKIITLYAEKGKRLSADGIRVFYTDYGRGKFNLFVNDKEGTLVSSGSNYADTLLSNRVLDYDKTREMGNWELAEKDYRLMAKETIDFTKDTYLYVSGQEAETAKYKIVVGSGENPVKEKPRAIPAKTGFDKRADNSANVIINLIDFNSAPNVLINGQKVNPENNYAVNADYLVLSKDYLSKFDTGKKLSIALESGGQKANVEISITDTTDKNRKPVFADVTKNDLYRVFIESLADRKIIAAGQNFYPEKSVTKAEFCAMLSNALGIGSQGGNKYNGSMKSLDNYKILAGTGAQQTITYKQASRALIQVMQANSDRNKKIIDSLEYEYYYDEDESYVLAACVPVVDPELVASNKIISKKECAKAIYRFISLSDLLKDDKYVANSGLVR